MRNEAVVYGEDGFVRIQDPWTSPEGTTMTLTRYGGKPYNPRAQGDDGEPEPERPWVETFNLGCTGAQLYANEADAVAEFLEAGECPYMTVEDTLRNMRCLDRMRESCGLKFRGE
jgi:predicted dehydrogenase